MIRAGAQRKWLGLLVTAGALLGMAPAAHAAIGDLTGQGCISDMGDPAGCGAVTQGLNAASDVAMSPDGKSVYAVSSIDDAIVRFDRNTATGALTPQGCIADEGDAIGCGTDQEGLGDPFGVAVSPDGKSVYVVSAFDDAIARFDRNTTTGALTPQGCIADAGNSHCGMGVVQQGLNHPAEVTVSPDNKSVYVVSGSGLGIDADAVVHFSRNTTTGALAGQGCIADVGSSSGCPAQQGLGDPFGVAVSPDDKSVYVSSFGDDAVVRFDRNTTSGALTFQGCFTDVGGIAGCGTQEGLDGAAEVAVSPDGNSVYVTGRGDLALVRFDRNSAGALVAQGCVRDPSGSAACGATQPGFVAPQGVALSPDSKTVYVAAPDNGTLARLDRNTTSGALTPGNCIADVGVSGCATTQQGLGGAGDVAVSPDGRSVYTSASGDSAVVTFAREADPDGDGLIDAADNCPDDANAGQANNDGDAQGDACDPDDDNDGVNDGPDNCDITANANQANNDGDALGDVCDADDDNDGVDDGPDNCDVAANADQANNDGDVQGDACDADDDNDGILDAADNCSKNSNSDQGDADGDGAGDACDASPTVTDADGDGVADGSDNCPRAANPGQADSDGDGSGDACDPPDSDDGDNGDDAPPVECSGKVATIVGTESNDTLRGTSGDDVIAALGGGDSVKAGAGNDTVCAGTGDDAVNGQGGKDKLFGENGADDLVGGGGSGDLCDGGKQRDDAAKSCEKDRAI